MTSNSDFPSFCDNILGTWVGDREGPRIGVEKVKAVWERTLDGSFLRESWYTSGPEGVLRLRALALLKVDGGTPAEFVVAYTGGKIALGDSGFDSGQWILTHRWLGGETDARIALHLVGHDGYEQVVHSVDVTGRFPLESRSVLVREG